MHRPMTQEQWMDKLRALVDNDADFARMSEWYSWAEARDDDLTPEQALIDCIEWLRDELI